MSTLWIPPVSLPAAARDAVTGSGTPLDDGLRARMERSFSHDFSAVRVHCDERARRAATSLGARAFSVGDHIVLGPGLHPADPGLLAHELTHVVQHRLGAGTGAGVGLMGPLEQEAAAVGAQARSGQAAVVRSHGVVPALQRAPQVKGGVETTEVSPEIARLLNEKGIPFAREVTFELLDADGRTVLKGRMDYFFRDPRTGAAIIAEAKGLNLEALTPNQKIYVARFEQEGATIRITSRKGGTANLYAGDKLKVRWENFLKLGRVNLKDFASALEQITSGAEVKYSLRDAKGVRWFTTEADFEAELATKGMTRVKAPPLDKPPEQRPLRPPGKPAAPTPQRPAPDVAPTPAGGSPVTAAEGAAAEGATAKALSNREVVHEIARTNNMRVRKEGGFATIEGMSAVVLLVSGALLFIYDVRKRGLVPASKDFALGAAAFKGLQATSARFGMRVPIGLWTGLGVGALMSLPSDQGARAQEETERMGTALTIIHAQYPGVLAYVGNEWCLWPFGWPCIEVNSPWETRDRARLDMLFPEVMKLLEHPWELEPLTKPAAPPPAKTPLEQPRKWPTRGRMAP
jgi:Domain of unknown function (DUF4157)